MTAFRKGDRVITPGGWVGVVAAVVPPQWGGRVEVKVAGGNFPLSYEPDALTLAGTKEAKAA